MYLIGGGLKGCAKGCKLVGFLVRMSEGFYFKGVREGMQIVLVEGGSIQGRTLSPRVDFKRVREGMQIARPLVERVSIERARTCVSSILKWCLPFKEF